MKTIVFIGVLHSPILIRISSSKLRVFAIRRMVIFFCKKMIRKVLQLKIFEKDVLNKHIIGRHLQNKDKA